MDKTRKYTSYALMATAIILFFASLAFYRESLSVRNDMRELLKWTFENGYGQAIADASADITNPDEFRASMYRKMKERVEEYANEKVGDRRPRE